MKWKHIYNSMFTLIPFCLNMWTCVFKNTYKKKYNNNNNKKNTCRSLESKNIILRIFFQSTGVKLAFIYFSNLFALIMIKERVYFSLFFKHYESEKEVMRVSGEDRWRGGFVWGIGC